ncbi:hypothetical protein C1646_669412 [Rhizophagus diaphanus]|nr:hypothetical protein C1646_669412 [Rhizophagus diaphanus] [Rhizophagus sp. MUCL 43196]
MPRVKKKVLHLRKIAKISAEEKQQKSFENIDDNEEYNSSDNEDLDMEFEWENRYFEKKGSLFQILIDNMKILKSSKRPLTYHGNFVRTKRRKRKSIHEAIKTNGQTLDKIFILSKEKIDGERKNNDEREEWDNDDEKEERNNDEE